MAKELLSTTVDTAIIERIEKLAAPKNEDRSLSKMTEILLREALDARDKKTKSKR